MSQKESGVAADLPLKGAPWIGIAVFLLLCLLLGWKTLALTQGHLTYTLDDPYIHLALAEQIAHGTYGINAHETAAPSSSVVWPFLLLPGVGTRWHEYLPFALNLIFGCAAAFLLGKIADLWPWRKTWFGRIQQLLATACFILISNLAGLTFTGMEHVLQVLLAIASAWGLLKACQGERIPWWCIAAAILGPGVRYESLAITLAMAIALAGQKRWKTALATAGLSLLLPAGLGIFLVTHGQSFLPNSVLSKGNVFHGTASPIHNLLAVAISNMRTDIFDAWRRLLLLITLSLAVFAFRSRGERSFALWGAVVALALHLTAGTFGWFYRYEVYAVVFAVALLFGCAIEHRKALWIPMTLVLALCARHYIPAITHTPGAARNVYEQQYQMHRFLTEYDPQNVAVHDLGWMSYKRNPGIYVLDLNGLGSHETLLQRNKDMSWLDAVTRRHHIELVIAYGKYFQQTPPSWRLLAELHLGSPRVTAAESTVDFYVTALGNVQETQERLRRFNGDLPPNVTMEMRR